MAVFAVAIGLVGLMSAPAFAAVFGAVSGNVRDAQDRPVQGAAVTLHATSSAWTASTTTDATGSFRFPAVPIGDYSVTVTDSGFAPSTMDVTVISSTAPVLPFRLQVAAAA